MQTVTKLSDAVKGGAREKEGDALAPFPLGKVCLPSGNFSIFVGDRIGKNPYVLGFQCTKPREENSGVTTLLQNHIQLITGGFSF